MIIGNENVGKTSIVRYLASSWQEAEGEAALDLSASSSSAPPPQRATKLSSGSANAQSPVCPNNFLYNNRIYNYAFCHFCLLR